MSNPIVLALLYLAGIVLGAGIVVWLINLFYPAENKYKQAGLGLIALAALVLAIVVLLGLFKHAP